MHIDFYYLAVTTVTLASIYGLLAVGISIIWSSLGMINMAHGFTFAVSGYGAWLVAQNISTNGVVVLAGGVLTGMLSGAVIGGLAFVPLYDKPNFAVRSLIATLAIALFGSQCLLWAFGPRVKALPPIFPTGGFKFGTASVSYDRLGAIVCSIVLLLAMLAWMKRSRRGLEIRAMMQNPEGAALVGVGLRSTAIAVMMVTGGLAGLAAVLLSRTYFVSPFAGAIPLVKGIIVALAGGLGSLAGALIAAALLGLVEALTAVGLGGRFVLITQFLVIIIILLIRPRGIAGMLERTRE
ncbi:MAG: branched-chain amino acid ABC transporter permease [Alphaproteobacteria bacterium]|nr:branched-chain amino acid ABC transporter permease [Alphaproteobacteria bacterium]